MLKKEKKRAQDAASQLANITKGHSLATQSALRSSTTSLTGEGGTDTILFDRSGQATQYRKRGMFALLSEAETLFSPSAMNIQELVLVTLVQTMQRLKDKRTSQDSARHTCSKGSRFYSTYHYITFSTMFIVISFLTVHQCIHFQRPQEPFT